jgi:hypothetical protein
MVGGQPVRGNQRAAAGGDGIRSPVPYPSGQPMFEVLARDLSGTVTDWRVSVSRTDVKNEQLPGKAPVWTVVFPIGLTALLSLVLLEAFLMARHWRAIPPHQRPAKLGELPEFRGVSAMNMALCVFGLVYISIMTALIWLTWAQAT